MSAHKWYPGIRAIALMNAGCDDLEDRTLDSKGTCAWQDPSLGELKNLEPPFLQDSSSGPIKMSNKRTKSKKPEQNEEKFCTKSREQKSPPGIPFSNGEFAGFSERF
jgi:hypothetical protein